MTTHFRNWTEALGVLRARAAAIRGSDGDTPKTTNGDVIDIAAVIDPSLKARFRTSELGARWESVRDAACEAALAPHAATFAKNSELWSAITDVCAYLDAVPVPDFVGVLAEHLGEDEDDGDGALRNAGPKEDGPFAQFEAKTYDDLWRAQRDYLAQKRGFDQPPPPPGFGMAGLKIPRSTNQDVLQLATYWSQQLAKAKQVMGYKDAVDKWHAIIADVDRLAKTGKPDGVYPKNNEFWHASNDIAIQIAIGDESPSKWDMVVGSVKDSVSHLPATLEHTASTGADLVASAAHAAGKIVNEAGKGLFSGFGLPLLVGGGLLGVYLISRSRYSED